MLRFLWTKPGGRLRLQVNSLASEIGLKLYTTCRPDLDGQPAHVWLARWTVRRLRVPVTGFGHISYAWSAANMALPTDGSGFS
jgi:hypothetical protein